MAIQFDKENDPVAHGNVNVESMKRNRNNGWQMAGVYGCGRLALDGIAEPARDDTVVNNPAAARKTGLAF